MPARSHGMTKSPEYKIWCAIKRRCHVPTASDYKYYGARGIAVCAEWRGPGGFEHFYAHIGPRPLREKERIDIDRIDGRRGYEPGNVRWVTQTVNERNKLPESRANALAAMRAGLADFYAGGCKRVSPLH